MKAKNKIPNWTFLTPSRFGYMSTKQLPQTKHEHIWYPLQNLSGFVSLNGPLKVYWVCRDCDKYRRTIHKEVNNVRIKNRS